MILPPPPPPGFHGDSNGMRPPHIGQNMPPPPPFNIDEIPDSLKERFFVFGDKSLFQQFFSTVNLKRNDEGYDVNNLPGGGW